MEIYYDKTDTNFVLTIKPYFLYNATVRRGGCWVAFISRSLSRRGQDTPPLYTMGKVHGSLARAGKVKGQTPKIDKIEKKKQPRGRWVVCLRVCGADIVSPLV